MKKYVRYFLIWKNIFFVSSISSKISFCYFFFLASFLFIGYDDDEEVMTKTGSLIKVFHVLLFFYPQKKNWCRVDPVFADYFMNDFCITRIAGGDRRFICLVNCSKNRFFDENMIFWTVDCVWLKKIIFHDVKSGSYCPLAPLFFRKLCFTVRHSPKSYNYTV